MHQDRDRQPEVTPGTSYSASGRMPAEGWRWLVGLWLLAAVSGAAESVMYTDRPLLGWLLSMALGLWIGLAGCYFIVRARCRHRLIAAAAGAVAGALVLLSAFSIDRHLERPHDSLTSYLAWRLETGRHLEWTDETGEGAPDGSAADVDVDEASPPPTRLGGWQLAVIWVAFGVQVTCTVSVSALLPWRVVQTDPYCEACDVYLVRDVFALPPGTAAAAVKAIVGGQLHRGLTEVAVPYNPGEACTVVSTLVCPDGRSCGHREGYASVLETDGSPDLLGPFHPANIIGHIPLEVGRLAPADLAALRPTLASTRDGTAYQIPSSLEPRLDDSSSVFGEMAEGDRTVIEDVQGRSAGVVLGRPPGPSLRLLVQLTPVLGILGGLVAVIVLLERAGLGAIGSFLAALVGLAIALLTALTFRDPFFFEGLLPYLRAKASIGQRADAVVDPDDRRAFFVDIVPRANWGRSMSENATDLGFLRADVDAGELLYEGDRQRYRIPASKLVAIERETLGHSVKSSGLETNQRLVLILHVEHGDRWIEIVLTPRHAPCLQALRRGYRGHFERLASAVETLMPEDVADP